ncbi:alpha/beta fold hydrolase [Cryobacterium lactosi]|uniref:alpha/beta fold hydrolase n=1 Tax=Cryobacterium lactosi TaxID=1259202 RepID=UPI0018E06916|nr:alpha/beta fold hydrolase [Cryobacterium lactosi]
MFLAGCTVPTEDESAVGAGLEQFMEQDLEFGACDPMIVNDQPPVPQVIETAESADCATLEVPLDYENLGGEKIQLALSRIAASGNSNDRLGSVVINPGGPGFPATTFAPIVATLWADGPIAENFDVVGFDPRGVGLSSPSVDCYTNEERDANEPISAFGTWTEESTRAIVEKCAEGSGGEDMLAHLGTRDVARDMDVLRSALGDDKLTYAGLSYGSRLGTVYAEMFPDKVRALVLDGAVDPLQDTQGRQLQQAAGIQAAFDRFSEFCATQNPCPVGTDPAQASAAVQGLLQPLVQEPLLAADGRELTFLAAADGILSGLYSESLWPGIAHGLTELQAGRPDALLALRDGLHGRLATGEYTNNFEATFAINCVDEERLTEKEMSDLGNEMNESAPFLDSGTDPASLNGCAEWPGESTLGFPYATDIEGLPQVLVTSAIGDPVTPHDGGISLAETLDARLLTVDANEHGTIASGIDCVDEVVADYLVNLELPEEGARCSL